MTEDGLQWIAIVFLLFWLTMTSVWIGETTSLLRTWWEDFLRDMVSKEYRDRLEKVRGWGFSSKLERMRGPENPYKPKPLRYPPQKRNRDD